METDGQADIGEMKTEGGKKFRNNKTGRKCKTARKKEQKTERRKERKDERKEKRKEKKGGKKE